jgi:hypothetical protein
LLERGKFAAGRGSTLICSAVYSGGAARTSGPIPKLVSIRGTFRYELRNQRTTSNLMILVRFQFEAPITIVPQQLIRSFKFTARGLNREPTQGPALVRAEPQTVISMSVDRDHDIGGLDHGGGRLAGRELELIHGFVGDRGGDDGAAAECERGRSSVPSSPRRSCP